jgi:hypothetical protein
VAKCLRCEVEFVPRKRGHVYHSAECRHGGPRKPGGPVPPNEEMLARLNGRGRSEERVDREDWHPAGPGSTWIELDLCQTVATRLRWHQALVEERSL